MVTLDDQVSMPPSSSMAEHGTTNVNFSIGNVYQILVVGGGAHQEIASNASQEKSS